jgi:PAS domain S-box-containing protein
MEDILQTIMENTNTQLMYLDPQFNFVRANSAYVRGSGHSWEELIGRNYFDLFPNPENRAIFERVRDSGQPVAFHARPFEYADQPERGVTYWDWTLTPVKDGSGQVQGLVCSLLDVTEQVRAEQEREQLLAENRRQRALLEQLVETASIGIAVLHGPDHRYERVNSYYQSIPGTPNVPMLGRTIGEVFPDSVAQVALRLVDEVYRTGRTVSIREYRASVGPGREQTYWNVDHVPLSGPDGKVERVLILANEVTEYVQARTQIEALAAKALHQAEELSTVFAAITDAVTVYDKAGIPVQANPAAVAGYGLDPVGVERVILAQKIAIHHPDGRRLAVDELPTTHALQGETVIEQRLILTTAAGQERIVLASAAPLLAGGQVSGAVMVWHDITEREQAERARDRLIAVLDQTPDMISTATADGRILYLNRAARKILGIPEGADLSTVTLPGGQPDWANTLLQTVGIPTAMREGLWQGETAVPSHDGREIPMSQVILAHKEPNGEVEYLSTVARDISERQRYLAQLEAERTRLKAVIDNAPEAIVVIDEACRVVLTNAAADRLYARPLLHGQDFESQAALALSYPDGTPCDPRDLPLTRSALDGEEHRNVEMAIVWPDGQRRALLASSAPIRDRQGGIVGAVGVFQDITERKRTREALRESEEKLRKVIDLLPIGISVLDQDRNVRHLNPALSAILGMPAEALLRGNFRQRIYLRADGTEMLPEELPSARAFNEQTMIRDAEIGIVKEDGKLVWTSVSAAPLPFSDWGVVVATADITERKQAQETLHRYAGRLQALHLIDQALLTAQSAEEIADTALPYVRRMMLCLRIGLALFDFEVDEMRLLAVDTEGVTQLGKGWRGSLKMTSFLEEIKEGEPHVVEDLETLPSLSPFLEILRAEGVRAYVQIPLVVQGSLIGSLSLGMSVPGCPAPEEMDIAREVAAQLALAIHHARLHEQVQRYADELEQRVAQRTAELQASEARFRSIFEGSALGIALADAQGRVLASNPALQEMLGCSEQELRYRTLTEFAHPDDIAANEALHQELTTGIRDGGKLESRFIRKGGQVICGDLTVSLARGAGGDPMFTVSMVEDVTEWKEIQEALLWTEKLTIAGRLGASLAHEINNPLQSVIGCLGLADKVLAEGGDASRYLQVAREELRRAARTVAQLRDLHRLPKPEKRKSTDVNTLLERVLLLSRKKCEEHRIHVVWKPADDLPPLLLASDQMRQVFLNLVLNALDALPKGGKLEVNTARTGQPAGVSIVFADNGSGIAPDVVSHLFDPFFSTKPQGLGLGLFTSRRIVEEHGGHVDVVSQVGKGTTFTVWLPE